jgi:ABC-2 type transport system ATP-binding protein
VSLLAVEQTEAPDRETGQGAVEASNLHYVYEQDRGLHGLTISVPEGAIFGLLGSNGSGKTTFLLVVAGLIVPTSGAIRVLGSLPGRSVARRSGWVFQEQALDRSLTVSETLALSARLYGSRSDGRQAAVRVGLEDRFDDRVETLSGGMRRRLELARAIQHGPDLLVMDEPTLGLDIESKRDFWSHLRELNREGLTVLLATNDVAEAEASCDQLALLRHGGCIAQGRPDELDKTRGQQSIHLRWPGLDPSDASSLRSLEGVSSFAQSGENLRLTTRDARGLLAQLGALTSGRLESVQIGDASLEDTYFQLTGTTLDRAGSP